jgi:hypothetical protein
MTIDTKKLREIAETAAAALLAIYEHRRKHSPTTEWRNRRDQLDGHFIDVADPVLSQMREVLDELENNTCARHAGQAHGAEAEELRRGVERLLSQSAHFGTDAVNGAIGLIDLRRALQSLLDRVDARDSLAYLDARDAKLAEAMKRGDDLAAVGIQLVNLVDALHKATAEQESKIGKLWESKR